MNYNKINEYVSRYADVLYDTVSTLEGKPLSSLNLKAFDKLLKDNIEIFNEQFREFVPVVPDALKVLQDFANNKTITFHYNVSDIDDMVDYLMGDVAGDKLDNVYCHIHDYVPSSGSSSSVIFPDQESSNNSDSDTVFVEIAGVDEPFIFSSISAAKDFVSRNYSGLPDSSVEVYQMVEEVVRTSKYVRKSV